MAVARKRRDSRRVPLTRERVLSAAVELADRSGIDAVTMRRLARELGVEAMSLYHHVASKDHILEGIVEIVVGQFALPTPGGDWKAQVRQTAITAHAVLVRHPWSARLILSAPGLSHARLRYMNSLLGTFRQAGFSEDLTDHAYHALDSHIMGFSLWQAGMNLGTDEDLAVLAADFLRHLPADEFPYVVEHVHQHMKPRKRGGKGEFAFGLDLLLDGLERMLLR